MPSVNSDRTQWSREESRETIRGIEQAAYAHLALQWE